jgi:hypothetical protein
MGHVNQAEAMVRAVVTWGLLAELAGHGQCLARGRVVAASLAAGTGEDTWRGGMRVKWLRLRPASGERIKWNGGGRRRMARFIKTGSWIRRSSCFGPLKHLEGAGILGP